MNSNFAGKGEGIAGVLGIHMYTLVYLKCITNKDLLYITENSSHCYVTAWMGGKFGGEWIYVYVRLSPLTFNLSCHNIVNRLYHNAE